MLGDAPFPRLTFEQWKPGKDRRSWHTMSPTYDVLMGVGLDDWGTARVVLALDQSLVNSGPFVRVIENLPLLLAADDLVFLAANLRGDWVLGSVSEEDAFSLLLGDLEGNILVTTAELQRGWSVRQVFMLYHQPHQRALLCLQKEGADRFCFIMISAESQRVSTSWVEGCKIDPVSGGVWSELSVLEDDRLSGPPGWTRLGVESAKYNEGGLEDWKGNLWVPTPEGLHYVVRSPTTKWDNSLLDPIRAPKVLNWTLDPTLPGVGSGKAGS